jgi:hypothetical protein
MSQQVGQEVSPYPRWLTGLALVTLLGAVVVCFGLWPVQGGDILMHLTVGRWVWQHRAVPLVDVFSYTTPGEAFIAHSWLAGVAFDLTDRVAGIVGFQLFRCTLLSVAVGCAVRTAKALGAPWSAVLLLAPVVLVVMWGRLELRPHLVTTALLAAQLWLLVSVHTGRRSWRGLWTLPPAYVLWVNWHGGWAQGAAMLMAVFGALGLMGLRRRWLGGGATSRLSWRQVAPVLVACGLALLVNPYGIRLVTFPLEMQAAWIRAGEPEWQSPWMNAAWRDVGGGEVVSMQPVFWAYMTVLVGVLLATVRQWRTADLLPLTVMGLWLALSLRHFRAVSDAVLLTSPLVAAALSSPWWWARRWPGLVGIGLTLAVVSLAVPGTVQTWAWTRNSVAEWVMDKFSCVAALVERYDLSGRLFSDSDRHPLLYQFYPRMRLQATWEYVAGPQHWSEIHAALQGGGAGLAAHFGRYQVDVVMLTGIARAHIPALQAQGWVVVHLDDMVVVMVPQRRDTQDLIRREGYRWLPLAPRGPSTPVEVAEVLEEAERAIAACPQFARDARTIQGSALERLGRHQEARTQAR